MKRITKYSLWFLTGLVFTLSACNDDFLETQPSDSISDADAVATTDNAYAALNGLAEMMSTQWFGAYSQGFSGEGYVMMKTETYPSQNYLYNQYAAGWQPVFNMDFNTRDNATYSVYMWNYYYGLITGANVIINRIDAAEGSDADKQFIKASALAFRAFAFEKLIRYYCYRYVDSNNGAAKGLILRTDESTGSMPLSTLEETYAQVYKDCQEAIDLFTASGITERAGVWIPNINVAHAVFARAALMKQDYATALTHANAAKEGFPLMSAKDYVSGFCKPTSEWIFGSFGDATEQLWYWSYGTQYACNGYYADKSNTGAGAIDINLIRRIPNNDVRKALFITEDKFTKEDGTPFDWYNEKETNEKGQTYDIMDKTFGIVDGEKLWEAVDAYCKKMTVEGLNRPYSLGWFYIGGQLKFHVFDTPGVSYLPFIRTSEMYLIEAEANFKLGNEAAAIAALEALNKTSGRNPEYACAKTGDELWEEIVDYRAVELWGEGFEWSDYKRWKRPIVRKGFADGGNAHVAVAVSIPVEKGNNWTWVIPQNEVEFNEALKPKAE